VHIRAFVHEFNIKILHHEVVQVWEYVLHLKTIQAYLQGYSCLAVCTDMERWNWVRQQPVSYIPSSGAGSRVSLSAYDSLLAREPRASASANFLEVVQWRRCVLLGPQSGGCCCWLEHKSAHEHQKQ